jgi:plasmid stabilization system protein ParE
MSRDGSMARGILLCGGGLLLDLLAFSVVLSQRLRPMSALSILCLHGFACAGLALGLHGMMPRSQQSDRRSGLLFLAALNFFMPMFGPLGMLGGLLAERFFPNRPPPPSPWLSVEMPPLPPQPSNIAARPEYGDGALSAMLRYCPNPERRLSAVLAVRRLRDKNDAEVLRLALTDAVDDVRLLAYSILDHKEQAMNARLRLLQSQLQSAADEPLRARLHKRIGEAHFELVAMGLSRGEVQTYLLSEARNHVGAALQFDADDRDSLFLLGRIALHQGDIDGAEKAFLRAQVLGMALEKVLPYLAELAFRQQRYTMVSHYLRAIDPVYCRTQPQLSGIAAHWLPEEAPCPPK